MGNIPCLLNQYHVPAYALAPVDARSSAILTKWNVRLFSYLRVNLENLWDVLLLCNHLNCKYKFMFSGEKRSLHSAASHYLNQCWVIVNWTLRNKIQWSFNQSIKIFIHENASENIVCEMAAILSRGEELSHRFHLPFMFLGMNFRMFFQ